MNRPFELPLPLLGLSIEERDTFYSLPWQTGTVDDIPLGNTSFLLNFGEVVDQTGAVYQPGKNFMGIIPFVKRVATRAIDRSAHEVAYINSDELIDFFLKHPRAMLSYLRMQEQLGETVLTKWKSFPRVLSVVSKQPRWQSAHLALGLASHQARGGKVLVLEAQPEGSSIYSLLNQEAAPALVQSKENETVESFKKLIDARIEGLNGKIDLLNLQYLSIWRLERDEWATLFWHLKEKYKCIVAHLGSETEHVILHDSDAVFEFHADEAAQNNKCLHFDINIKAANNSEGVPVYPVAASDEGEIALPHQLDSYDTYYSWLEKHFGRALKESQAFFVADSFNNPAGLIALLHYLHEKIGEKDSSLPSLFQENFFVVEGISNILASLAAVSQEWGEFEKVVNRIIRTDFLKLFKPRYPRGGIFAVKPVQKYLLNIFGNISQQSTAITSSSFDNTANDVRWLNSGMLVNNLLSSCFPHGFLQNRNNGNTGFSSTNSNQWLTNLATFLRLSHKKVKFIYFPERRTKDMNNLAEKLLISHSAGWGAPAISGKFASLFRVNTAAKNNLWQNEKEIHGNIRILGRN